MATRNRHTEGFEWIGSGKRGLLDGDALTAELNRPFGVCVLRDGMLIFTDTHNNAVRFVIPSGTVKTLDSSGLLTPKGIITSADERHLFVCDTGHHKIKLAALPSRSVLADVDRITEGVEMFAFAGSGKKGWRDGNALEATFNSPAGVCEYTDGSIVVADTGNHCIRQIRRALNGKLVVKTIAGAYASLEATGGKSRSLVVGKRISGYRDGLRSLFRSPSAIIAGPNGELLVADTMNNCIRGLLPPSDKNSPWKVTTVCGQMQPGYADGNCKTALFDQPVSLCWGETSKTFFVADRGNNCIRQVGRSYDDGLSFSWVRTIEIGSVPHLPRSGRVKQLYQCSHPLGMVCMRADQQSDTNVSSKLVICDGGDNVIKILSLTQEGWNVKDQVQTPQMSDTKSIQTTFGSSCRSYEDLKDSNSLISGTDSECSIELGDGCRTCLCGSSRALNAALTANAALQAENLRLKELLECTFDEIELADRRFSSNYRQKGYNPDWYLM